jgi:hypothetical protein
MRDRAQPPWSRVISHDDTPIELKFDMMESMRQGDDAFTHEGLRHRAGAAERARTSA